MVTPYYHPRIGGLETYARQLAIAMQRLHDWDVTIVTSAARRRDEAVSQVDGLRVYRLGTWAKLSNTPVSPLWPVKIRRIVREVRPDLILAHTPVPSMADAAALAAGRTPIVIAYHAATLMKAGSPVFNGLARAYQVYQRATLSRADHILAVSDYVRQCLPANVRGKVTVLPNAVWEDSIRERVQPPVTRFLFVGSLDRTHSWKGLDLILLAVARYRQAYDAAAELTILGGGNGRASYEEAAARLGMAAAVHFRGWQTGAEKEAAFAEATALIVYPTTANDAFPTVILEAWARAVPVVAARIGALPALIDDGTDGYLAKPGDPAALADVLHHVAASSPAERAKTAATAARRLRERYTWERQAGELCRLAGTLR